MSAPTAPNPSTAFARVLVDELMRGGVTDAVLAPGSRSAALAFALAEAEGLRLHTSIDERSAGFVALGLARASGRPAPVLVTSGTAAANLLPAAVEADAAGVPWLALTADRPPELRDAGANQTIDQTHLFGRRTRWFHDPGPPEDRPGAVAAWRSMTARALAEAEGRSGRPGPVQLNLPFREPTVPASDDGRSSAAPFTADLAGRPDGAPWTRVAAAPRSVPAEAVASLADLVAATEAGVVIAGDAEVNPAAAAGLARVCGWPLLAEPLSPARAHAETVSTAHWLASAPAFAEAHRPEVVLRLGRSGLSRPLAGLLAGATEVLVDPDGRWLDPSHALATLLVGDVDTTARALAAALPGRGPSAWSRAWADAEARARAALDAALDAEPGMSEPRTARDVAAAVPDGGALVVASSMPVRDLDATMAARDGLVVHANRGASGIDGFVGTTLGVALGHDGPTVALAGDLSLLHDVGALLLRADGPLDVTIVVADNDGGGIFSHLPQAAYPSVFERVFGTPHGVDLAALAGAHGVPYERVDDPAALGDAVRRNLDAGGVRLVAVATEREEQVAVRRRLGAAVAAALD